MLVLQLFPWQPFTALWENTGSCHNQFYRKLKPSHPRLARVEVLSKKSILNMCNTNKTHTQRNTQKIQNIGSKAIFYPPSNFLNMTNSKQCASSPLAAPQLSFGISCHDYEGSHQCQYVAAESFDLASKSSHFLQSEPWKKSPTWTATP